MSDQNQNNNPEETEEDVVDATQVEDESTLVDGVTPTDATEEETTLATNSDAPVLTDLETGEDIVVDPNAAPAKEPEYATPNAESETEDSESTDEVESRFATPNATSSLLNLESLINGYIVDLEKLREKKKTQQDMFNDAFNNDAEYSQMMQKAKEMNRTKSAAKQRIMKMPNVVEVSNKLREYKEEMKDIQEGLSTYLQQYQQLSGSNQITRDNGEVQ